MDAARNPVLRAVTALRRLVGAVAAGMGYAAGWGFVACALFITGDVVARAFFRVSSGATTEITGYMLAFGLSWGLAHGLATRTHVRIDLLVNKLPPGIRVWLHLLALTALLGFAAIMAHAAWNLVEESLLFSATDISLLRIPLAIPQGVWAGGIAVLVILAALMLVENLLLALAGDTAAVDANLSARSYYEEAKEALEAVGAPEAASPGTKA